MPRGVDVIVEDTPRFVKRVGDYTIEGSNNTILIFGTDRANNGPASTSDGLGHRDAQGEGRGTGTIHLIAGRAATDPNFSTDQSFVYLSRKTDVDTNLNITAGTQAQSGPAAVVKSDCVRIVSRTDTKILAGQSHLIVEGQRAEIKVGNTKIVADGTKITLEALEVHLARGAENPWDMLFQRIISYLQSHDHIAPPGIAAAPTTGPGPATAALVAALTAAKQAWDLKVK